MSKYLLIPLVLILMLPLVYSCSDDSDGNVVAPDPDAYRALNLRDNVLFNLVKSWNERNITRYDELLDDAFVFHFSASDIKSGNVGVAHWDRMTEMSAVGNMFDPNFTRPGQSPVSSVNLVLTYTEGEDNWQDVLPDEQQYPGETWHSKTFRYRLTIHAGNYTYVADNFRATIVVRLSDGDSGVWRIVSWSDDSFNLLRSVDRTPTLTQETTWGKMKTLFAD